ncbi:MAG TPA: hypothetical protein VGO11_00745 [Chthoniobacteraceae bacterium]|jgi:hypothetical protein|nr:hypothetical protein [Chthoniobacteraceae bacterium]
MDRPPNPRRHRARLVFLVFTLTFIASRVLVILIMTRRMPDLFLHLGGNHVHHLNYGIFLLALVGGLMLFMDLSDERKRWVACAYGLGMALTFDEFGMWLHLGGSYWQRASYDAVILLAALLGLLAFAPRRKRLGGHYWTAAAITAAAVLLFCWLSYQSLNFVDRKMGEKLRRWERDGAQ